MKKLTKPEVSITQIAADWNAIFKACPTDKKNFNDFLALCIKNCTVLPE